MSSAKKKTPLNKNISYKNSNTNNYSQYYILAGIIVLTIIIYAKSIHNGFINLWDDDVYVSNNRDIMDLSIHGLKILCTGFYVNCYLPLTMLTYALEYKFFGLNPVAYHIDNLILHLLNTILVYIFVKKVVDGSEFNVQSLLSPNSKLQTSNNNSIAIISCLLFAIHPMHVESVAWIAERKDLLYTFFYLASLIYYLKFKAKSRSPELREGEERRAKSKKILNSQFSIFNSYYFFSLFLFILSLLSKSMAVTLPVVLLLIDFFKLQFTIYDLRFKNLKSKIVNLKLLEKLPFFILALIFGIITFISQKAFDTSTYDKAVMNINIIDRFFMISYSLAFYIVKLFIPVNLSAIHPYPSKTGGFLPVIYYLSPLLIIGLLFLIIKIAKRTTINNSKIIRLEDTKNNLKILKSLNLRIFIFGILFYIITVSIVLMIITVGKAIVAERYTYIPYIGFFIIIGSIYSEKSKVKSQKSKVHLFALRSSLFAFCIFFSVLTYSRNKVWKDDLTLFNDVIEKHPDVSVAYNNRGAAKADADDYKGALEDYNKAIDLNPDYTMAYSNRGGIKFNLKDFKGALEDYNKAIALSPELAILYNNRGWTKANIEDLKGALEDYNKAIALDSSLEIGYMNRGSLKGNRKDFKGALQDFNILISLNQTNPKSFFNRGFVKSNLLDYRGALEDLNKAIALNPNFAMAIFNRGNVYLNLRDTTSACEDWNSALQLGWTEGKNSISLYCKK